MRVIVSRRRAQKAEDGGGTWLGRAGLGLGLGLGWAGTWNYGAGRAEQALMGRWNGVGMAALEWRSMAALGREFSVAFCLTELPWQKVQRIIG